MRRPISMHFQVAAGPTAAREARARLDELPVSTTSREELDLLVSELVTNSWRHGSLAVGTPIQIEIESRDGCVHVAVSDPGRSFARRPAVDIGSGWGLRLVEQLAERWGVQRLPHTTVWFDLRLTG